MWRNTWIGPYDSTPGLPTLRKFNLNPGALGMLFKSPGATKATDRLILTQNPPGKVRSERTPLPGGYTPNQREACHNKFLCGGGVFTCNFTMQGVIRLYRIPESGF